MCDEIDCSTFKKQTFIAKFFFIILPGKKGLAGSGHRVSGELPIAAPFNLVFGNCPLKGHLTIVEIFIYLSIYLSDIYHSYIIS